MLQKSKMDLQKICEKTISIVKETGDFIKEQSKNSGNISIEEKELNSLVSYVDKTAEKQIVNSLRTLIPDAGFITEENTVNIQGKTWEWIIDPLDGTTNFLYGLPCYSISIGLRREQELVAGFIYEIPHDEFFFACENQGAYLNNERIHVSQRKNLKESLLATGFPHNDFSRFEEYQRAFSFLMKNTRGLRRLGSAAVDLAYVACGRFDGFFEYGLSSWDVAAGVVIIKEAGGIVSDFSGNDNYLFGKELMASNPYIQKELQHQLLENFSAISLKK